jgi:hypothetical protein
MCVRQERVPASGRVVEPASDMIGSTARYQSQWTDAVDGRSLGEGR